MVLRRYIVPKEALLPKRGNSGDGGSSRLRRYMVPKEALLPKRGNSGGSSRLRRYMVPKEALLPKRVNSGGGSSGNLRRYTPYKPPSIKKKVIPYNPTREATKGRRSGGSIFGLYCHNDRPYVHHTDNENCKLPKLPKPEV